mmetsp:Transcript_4383/g.10487  ORF Transcript_4383/g.10487 Transcript_4383/m.10487 type:complete len:146 (-) Transcript_4383:1372-1809(-)
MSKILFPLHQAKLEGSFVLPQQTLTHATPAALSHPDTNNLERIFVDSRVAVQKDIGDLGASPYAYLPKLPLALVHEISQAPVASLRAEVHVQLLEGGVARGRQVLHALVGDGGCADVDVDESAKRRCADFDSFTSRLFEALGRFG